MNLFLQLRHCKRGLRKVALLLLLLATVIPSIAQDVNKKSISTQIFMDRLSGKIDADRESQRRLARQLGLTPVNENDKFDSFVAKPDTINGIVYMSAFVRVEDESAVTELERLGVVIQESFLDGKMYTTLIPIDMIDAVTDIAKVSRVNAATMMRTSTNIARQKTNVDDVLTYSADAVSAGLPNAYDGSGVVMGVIDTGIDFNHIAFKDASGNSRIKQAYVYNGSTAKDYTGSTITSDLTDDNTGDHGTHTSSTAGGSSVKVSGTTVTVTTDHANATYGGMAPGSDLYLAGINGLSNTYLSNAVNKMCTYADNQGKPLVVSNSWGSQLGPHDGTGDVADVYNSLFGDSHPNRVALFAASNDGGKSKDNEGGGYHVTGTSTSSNPLGTIVRAGTYSNTDAGYFYSGLIASAWARNTGVTKLAVKICVLDASTGAVLTSKTVTSATQSVSGLSSYYSGTLSVYYDQVESDKTQVILYSSNGITSSGTSTTTKNGSTYYKSKYTLAIQVYPYSGSSSSVVDIWGGNYGYFTNHLSTSGYTWTAGTDDGCFSDETTIANVISIGAYVSERATTNYAGTTTDYSSTYTNGDIAYFSSWGTAAKSPTGLAYPWITAPGARLIAGVNHNHTSSVDSYSYYGSTMNGDLKVNSSTNPYAYMEGTSMATPTAAGIVALWMQAANTDEGKQKYPNGLTVNDVKTIMKETAIHDSYTDTGANKDHFGNGKIDALAGIQYILPDTKTPTIKANPTALTFDDTYVGDAASTKTFTVTGTNLEGAITATLTTNPSNVFKLSSTSISTTEAAGGKVITVSFTPTAAGTYSGTVTLKSSNAESVTVTLNGNGKVHTPAITASPTTVAFGNVASGTTTTKTFTVTGEYLNANISLTKSGSSNFTIDKTSVTKNNDGTASATVTVTFAPTAYVQQSYTGTVTLASTGATSVTVNLTGTGTYTAPKLTANPTSLSFSGNSGTTYTKTVTVTGTNLQGNITAAIQDDANGFYTVSPTSFSSASQTVTVTWKPTAGGNSTANLVLTTTGTGANTVTVPINGTAQGPAITASPTSVTFSDAYATRTYTQTVTVTGTNLSQNITAAISGAQVYSIDKTSLTSTGGTITITYAPTVEGQTTATLTLSSSGASTVTVPITGTAQAATPTLMVTPATLNFSTDLTNSQSLTFGVTGRFVSQPVTLTLTDANGVFTIDPVTIPAESISETTPVTVTVTFGSETAGDYTGSVSLVSDGAESQTVNLTATANDGGTASDAYLDIAKYATIDEAGWRTALVNNLYKYTEYEDNECAWLTLPLYGAFVGARYSTTSNTIGSGHPQAWIECSLDNQNTYGGTTWTYTPTSTNPYNGSSTYFTSATARAMGYNSQNNRNIRTVSFYVTNATEVKMLGMGRSGVSSTYPASIKVYECTKNADGTVTASTTVTKSATSTSTSTTSAYNISVTGLDATKIYKVDASTYRGYMYEIGFKTPLNKPTLKADPTELSMRAAPGETTSATFAVKGKLLPGDVTATLTDGNGVFTLATTSISKANAETGSNVTVSFKSANEGSFTGVVTLTSGSLTATVNLTATCSDGGTATDAYLNIAKYATIDEAGATVSGMETIYKYTEYNDDACAWLTLSNYGAQQVAANQNWISTNGTLRGYTSTWSATDVFSGNTEYFGSNTAYDVYGSGSQIFYVTNCTQVKVYDSGVYSSYWSSYKTTLSIYECTENADGTLTAATTATDTQTSASSEGVMTSATLDASKIYKVQLTGGGDYPDIYEIGFQTPLNKPTLTADPAYIEFMAEPGETITETVTVTGARLNEDVTVTLTDANGVYTLDKSSISISEATAGAVVTVTFNAPEQMGSYRGQVTFTSGEATASAVFYGTVGKKGSAYSRYLDIAQYSTIATGNWYEGLFANPYKFAEYEADNCAWLTVPAALPYFAWNYNDQNWCGVSSNSSGGWYGHTWDATDVFQGTEYFKGDNLGDDGGTYARMMGGTESNSTSNTTIFYGVYQVTNCTQVKAYAYSNTGVSSTYPTFIQIYELTENADGTLTQSDTRTDIQTLTTSGQATMTSAELDADKIYFVAVGGYRGFTYEVAFRTPLPEAVTLAEVVEQPVENNYYRIADGDLRLVYISADGKKLYCKDEGKYANPTNAAEGQIDYVNETDLHKGDWDQSNWVALTLAGNASWSTAITSLQGYTIKGVKGSLIDAVNPVLELNEAPTMADGSVKSDYVNEDANTFVTCNFVETLQQGSDGNTYFFITPKPMEIANVAWAMWNEAAGCFVVPTSVGTSNVYNLDGGFYINSSEYNGTMPALENGGVYNFLGLVKQETVTASTIKSAPRRAEAAVASSKYVVYPLNGIKKIGSIDNGVVTGVNDVRAAKGVVEVGRYNVQGQRVDDNYRGVVIIVMSDGTARKVVRE